MVATAIEKPGNLGTLLRTADAVRAAALIVCDPVTDLFNPNVVRASVGTLFTVPAAQAGAETTRRWLAERGVRTVVTAPAAERCYTDHDLTGAVAVVLGNEQFGLDEAWLTRRRRRRVDPDAGTRRLGQRRHGRSGAAVRGAAPAPSGGSAPMS